MKLGFFVETKMYPEVDFNRVYEGNTMGIGGSEYHSVALAYFLTDLYKDVECILYTTGSCNLEKEGISKVIVQDSVEAAKKAKAHGVDVFFTNKTQCSKLYKLLDEIDLKTVVIAHNFYSLKECDEVSSCEAIKRNIFVSSQQYKNYYDMEIIRKSQNIDVFVPFGEALYPRELPKTPVVTYIGSLVPPKCFHILARAWKAVLKKCPDAKLKVIGSAKLYSRFTTLGKYGIAEQSYEEKFMPYLMDVDGKFLESVEFCGLVIDDKNEILKSSTVGIVNPGGVSETFCVSALEFESFGVPVVTKAYGGLVDTVKNGKTGILYKNHRLLAKHIVKLIKDENLNLIYGINAYKFARENFSVQKIVPQWYDVFKDVIADRSLPPVESQWIREIKKKIMLFESGALPLAKADSIYNSYNNYEKYM